VHRAGIPLKNFPLIRRPEPEFGRWQIMQASRLVEKKGLETTLGAFALFRKRWPRAALIICGDGPLRPHFELLARRLELGDSVRFTGFLSESELVQWYQQSHIFVHPSETAFDGNQEGIPNSLLEAMATGLPVIATRHGGIAEAVEHTISGLLVPRA
jgi:colanic acid/amylovoran biosynthesis glycosyltransferase